MFHDNQEIESIPVSQSIESCCSQETEAYGRKFHLHQSKTKIYISQAINEHHETGKLNR